MRYLALATLIVVAVVVVLTSFPRGPRQASDDPRYSSSTASPGPAQHLDPSRRTPPPLRGEAPWALSALPECFHQESQRSGSPTFARAQFPSGAALVPAGARLRVADCTLDVASDSAVVVRGDNRLFVPPVARFFVAGQRLILDRAAGGRVDVRVYALHDGARPDFERTGPRQPLRRRAQSES